MPLTDEEHAILKQLPPDETLIAELGILVSESSPTAFKEGVDRVGSICEAALERCGFRVGVMVTAVTGKHLIARRRGDTGKRILLIGHMDTVHPKDGPFRDLIVNKEGDRATGPGAADMKGGVIVMFAALTALERAGRLLNKSVTVVLNADEEIGSPHSTEIIRLEAEEADAAFAFEHGSEREGASAIVTTRRGIGRMVLHATGAAAHSGNEADRGASAIVELAHKIGEVSALDGREPGWNVNVGTFNGGTAANVVADSAEMTIDYRFPDKESGDELSAVITDIVAEPYLRNPAGRPLVRTVLREHLIRPPLVRTDAVAALAARVIEAGRDLGQTIVEEARGGSSDAALAFDAGCAAVCGLGVVGGAIHTDQEWIRVPSLRERAALCAVVLDRLLREG